MNARNGPRIPFLEECDERAAFEIPMKGWLSTQVELDDGSRYALYFSDPIRLQQDLDEEVRSGRPCFAEPGLVVLPELSVEAIRDAVRYLWKRGFFASLKAEPDEPVAPPDKAPSSSLQPTH